MGRNNQQRRRAKAKDRARKAWRAEDRYRVPLQPRPGSEEQRLQARLAVTMTLGAAACDCGECPDADWRALAADLFADVKRPGWAESVGIALSDLGEEITLGLWERGWMPRDLECVFGKHLSGAAATMARTAVSAQMRGYAEGLLTGQWRLQRAAMVDAVRTESLRELFAEAERAMLPNLWALALEVLGLLGNLPDIPFVQPLPGTSATETAMTGTAEGSRVYEKVRALLAKAESTDSGAEAEAFTAKAQQLITRYSIDEARLAAAAPRGETTAVRIPIEKPYEQPKAELLAVIAHANHCRAIFGSELGFSTVIGDATVLRSVELLFNSLLVQAQAALAREGSRRDAVGRSRTRSFRQSFLAAYGVRIGERLSDSADTAVREAETEAGTDLVPLLERRREAADEKAEELFPEMRMMHATRISDFEGHTAGRAAADRARLHGAEEIANP